MSIKRLISSKKAQGAGEIPIFGRKMIFFAITAVILGLLAVGYIMSTSAYVFKITATPKGLQDELYISRLFNHPGCFAYQDPNTQRVYPYWIDLQKFTDDRFGSCLQLRGKSEQCYEIRLATLVAAQGHPDLMEEPLRTIHSDNYKPSCTEAATIDVTRKPVIILGDSGQHDGIATVLVYTRQGQVAAPAQPPTPQQGPATS